MKRLDEFNCTGDGEKGKMGGVAGHLTLVLIEFSERNTFLALLRGSRACRREFWI